jgi:hypothetical protein
MSRQVSIHSDGTARGTVVLDDNGNEIADVVELSAHISVEGGTQVTLEIRGKPNLNLQGIVESVVFHCPLCSGSTDHNCDTAFGTGSSVVFTQGNIVAVQCPESLVYRDPYRQFDCIRQAGHDKRHFDGERVWEA